MSTLTVSNLQGTSASSNLINMTSGHSIYSPGGIIQVVQTVKSDTFTTTSTGSWVDITGLSAVITPKKSSSKILMRVTMTVSATPVNVVAALRLVRDSTGIGLGDASSSRLRATHGGTRGLYDTNGAVSVNMEYLDSPATTSATTYKVQVYGWDGATWVVNRVGNDPDNALGPRCISTVTLMEIAV
jgi:hypothetical protein